MYKFPIRIPAGWKLALSQGFKSKELVDYYKRIGVNITEHNGLDVVSGNNQQTFGSAVVWPFPWEGIVYDSIANAPIGATLAHAQIDTVDPDTGICYSMVAIHLSGVVYTQKYGEMNKKRFKQGEVIGFIGNNGAVTPKPTPSNPFFGSHLHLGLGVKNPGEMNFTMVDPSTIFDINDPYIGSDDPTKDHPVYQWASGFRHNFEKDIHRGDESEEVKLVQDALTILGYLRVPADQLGTYGPKTRNAVLAFQQAYKITSGTGNDVGPLTRAKLNAIFFP